MCVCVGGGWGGVGVVSVGRGVGQFSWGCIFTRGRGAVILGGGQFSWAERGRAIFPGEFSRDEGSLPERGRCIFLIPIFPPDRIRNNAFLQYAYM